MLSAGASTLSAEVGGHLGSYRGQPSGCTPILEGFGIRLTFLFSLLPLPKSPDLARILR